MPNTQNQIGYTQSFTHPDTNNDNDTETMEPICEIVNGTNNAPSPDFLIDPKRERVWAKQQ